MFGQQALGDALIEKQQIRIARLQRIEIEPRDLAAVSVQRGRMRAMAEREKRFDRAMLLQQLERARLDADRARIRRGRRETIDDAHRHAGPRKAHRRGETGRPRADDQHGRDIGQCVSHENLDDTRPCQSTPLRVTGPYADGPTGGTPARCGKIRAFRQF